LSCEGMELIAVWAKVRAVWLRELLDSVRDKRTLYMMVLLPIVLMPVMIVVGPVMMVRQQESLAREVPVAVVVGAENLPELAGWIESTGALAVERAPAGSDVAALETRLSEGEVQLVVEVPEGAAALLSAEQPVPIRVISHSGTSRSSMAADLFQSLLGRYGEELVSRRLAERGLSTELLEPFALEARDITRREDFGGRLLAMIVPFFIVVWAVVGGMYTAIDAGAGEKERNSLECLIMTPVPGAAIVAGKFLAVCTIALAAVVLLIGSASVSLLYMLPRLLGAQGLLSVNLTGGGLLAMLATMTLFVGLMSALQLALSVFSKSFREAQSYVSGLMFAVMFPAMYLMYVEEIGASLWTYAVPVLNVLLVCREVFMGAVGLPEVLVTLVSLAVALGLAFWGAVRAFTHEKVLFRT